MCALPVGDNCGAGLIPRLGKAAASLHTKEFMVKFFSTLKVMVVVMMMVVDIMMMMLTTIMVMAVVIYN